MGLRSSTVINLPAPASLRSKESDGEGRYLLALAMMHDHKQTEKAEISNNAKTGSLQLGKDV